MKFLLMKKKNNSPIQSPNKRKSRKNKNHKQQGEPHKKVRRRETFHDCKPRAT